MRFHSRHLFLAACAAVGLAFASPVSAPAAEASIESAGGAETMAGVWVQRIPMQWHYCAAGSVVQIRFESYTDGPQWVVNLFGGPTSAGADEHIWSYGNIAPQLHTYNTGYSAFYAGAQGNPGAYIRNWELQCVGYSRAPELTAAS